MRGWGWGGSGAHSQESCTPAHSQLPHCHGSGAVAGEGAGGVLLVMLLTVQLINETFRGEYVHRDFFQGTCIGHCTDGRIVGVLQTLMWSAHQDVIDPHTSNYGCHSHLQSMKLLYM